VALQNTWKKYRITIIFFSQSLPLLVMYIKSIFNIIQPTLLNFVAMRYAVYRGIMLVSITLEPLQNSLKYLTVMNN
jgi:hypothetical protein